MYSCGIVPALQQVSHLVLPDPEEAKDLTVYFVPQLSADLLVKWSPTVYATATGGAGKVVLHPLQQEICPTLHRTWFVRSTSCAAGARNMLQYTIHYIDGP